MMILVYASVSAGFGQPQSQLEIWLIGNGAGPYVAPAGQTTELKMEIFNSGPGDVYLVRGEAYLDPNLGGNWQLVHSEDTGNFHLTKLQSAIWTFNLTMPAQIHYANVTNGVPQVDLLIQVTYSNAEGQQQNANSHFL